MTATEARLLLLHFLFLSISSSPKSKVFLMELIDFFLAEASLAKEDLCVFGLHV
jgi:hypothetical protein